MDNYAKAFLRKKILRLVKRGALNEKKIVLFGASVFSKEIKNCLTEHGLAVSEIIDNDSRKTGTECMGLEVQKPETVLIPHDDNFVILILSGGYYREMVYQLTQMGYVRNKNIFILNFKTNESATVLLYIIARTIRGYVTYKKLKKCSSEKRVVFIAPYTGVGDIYLTGLLFDEYIKKNKISDYVFLVVSGACKKVAEMFEIKNTIVMKPTVTDDIIGCHHFLRTDWNIVILNDGWLGEASQWIRGYKGLNFEKVFRYFVFGFDDSISHKLPPQMDCRKEVDELFRKYSLTKGKTVVLSPYSNTLFDLPDDVLEAIVFQCTELGYSVCTNCAGTEKPIPGTAAVFFPLNMAITFMDAAGYFVGVRSGLCDVISSSSCKKVIFYEKEGFFYRSSQFEYFSLKKMGLCEDALEIEYSSTIKDEVLEKINSVLN